MIVVSDTRTVCIVLSCGRMGSVSHSSQVPGTDVVFAFDFQTGRHVRRHHAEGLLRHADVDGLPIAVEQQYH